LVALRPWPHPTAAEIRLDRLAAQPQIEPGCPVFRKGVRNGPNAKAVQVGPGWASVDSNHLPPRKLAVTGVQARLSIGERPVGVAGCYVV
jgi:hypothetical protein